MKNIILKSAIALVMLLAGTTYQATAKSNTEAKEVNIENQTADNAAEAGVKSKIRFSYGKMSYVIGIPLGSTFSTDFELVDRAGKTIQTGVLRPAKVFIFSSDNLAKGTYELRVGGKLYQEVTID